MKKLENGEYEITTGEFLRWLEFAQTIYRSRGKEKELGRVAQVRDFAIDALSQGRNVNYRFHPQSRQMRAHAGDDFANVVLPRWSEEEKGLAKVKL